MSTFKSLVSDLLDGKEVPKQVNQPKPKPAPVEAKPVQSTPRPDPHGPIYIPRRHGVFTKEAVEVKPTDLIDEDSICPDNDGKPHQISMSAGKKTCWLCGAAVDPNKRSKATSWQATVYGTKKKKELTWNS